MTSRAATLAARAGIGALAVGAIVGFGNETAGSPASSPTPTPTALDALTVTQDVRPLVPSAFADEFGYSPATEDGILVAPHGGCSSPIPLPSDFEIACKQHDLGYDLIRFASSRGAEDTARQRTDLDTRLEESMHRVCTLRADTYAKAGCTVMAEIAGTAVGFNTWRQHYGVPEPEPMLPFLLTGFLGSGVAAALLWATSPARSVMRATEIPS